MHPSASEHVRTRPTSSERVRIRPKTFENIRKRRTTYENVREREDNFSEPSFDAVHCLSEAQAALEDSGSAAEFIN